MPRSPTGAPTPMLGPPSLGAPTPMPGANVIKNFMSVTKKKHPYKPGVMVPRQVLQT